MRTTVYLNLTACLWFVYCIGSATQVQATEWGTLSGKIIYTGKPVKPAQLEITKDREVCCRDKAVHLNESFLVGKQGGLKNVFVYLQKTDFNQALVHPMYRKLPSTVDLKVKSCSFHPHATGVWYRLQNISVENQDPIAHNTHFFYFRNTPTSFIAPPLGMKKPLEFGTAEPLPTLVTCDIHLWEKAYVLIQDHPYFAITDETGAFEIKNIPVGKWKFQFWHEEGGYIVHEGKPRRGGKTMQIKPGNNDLGVIEVPPEEFDLKIIEKQTK
ncbi:hypothetical protein [Gimesia chilikensis]|nr:hypothetical protein [Gimesia chilikensis]